MFFSKKIYLVNREFAVFALFSTMFFLSNVSVSTANMSSENAALVITNIKQNLHARQEIRTHTLNDGSGKGRHVPSIKTDTLDVEKEFVNSKSSYFRTSDMHIIDVWLRKALDTSILAAQSAPGQTLVNDILFPASGENPGIKIRQKKVQKPGKNFGSSLDTLEIEADFGHLQDCLLPFTPDNLTGAIGIGSRDDPAITNHSTNKILIAIANASKALGPNPDIGGRGHSPAKAHINTAYPFYGFP